MPLKAFLVALCSAWALAAQAQQILELPSTSRPLTHYAWTLPSPERWVVTLHGAAGNAQTELGIWQKFIGPRPFGILSIQWWVRDGDYYLRPNEIYAEIVSAMQRLGIPPGRSLLLGSSIGAANLYAVAAIDARRGRALFSYFVASSGGYSLDYAPTRAIAEGRFGPNPFDGTRWITACGEHDPNPWSDGCPAMRQTAEWLAKEGGTVVAAIEDVDHGHGALQANPANAQQVLDLLAR